MATTATTPGQDQGFLPSLYARTDKTSKQQQNFFRTLTVIEIALSLIGAAAVVVGQITQATDWLDNFARIQILGGKPSALSLATAAAIIASALTLAVRYIWKPGERWRQARYIGETDASHAWRYATKATDFDLGTGIVKYESAEGWYAAKVDELLKQTAGLDLPVANARDEITDQMRALRAAQIPEQYQTYLDKRAAGQRDWYRLRARQFRAKRNFWRITTFVVYALGVGLLLARASSLHDTIPALSANYWPLIVAVVGGIGAWVASRHYEDLLQSYSYTSDKLALTIDTYQPGVTEFAQWVDKIEELMDNEHQQWHALA